VSRLTRQELSTPLGRLVLVGVDDRLQVAAFRDGGARRRSLDRRFGRFELVAGRLGAAREIEAYFAGDLCALARIEIDPGGTPFQRRVWRRLQGVPAGTTQTYGDLARALGSPRASRAVGAANGANPIAIVIPCHRLVGSTGSLTGYAYGLRRKRWLLDHEARHA